MNDLCRGFAHLKDGASWTMTIRLRKRMRKRHQRYSGYIHFEVKS